VIVHLKYPSAGFMLALAQGESQIQALHLAGTDDQSKEFMVGTGPFILTDYLTQVHLKYKRNPDYFKKDKYGNQLPYLDGLYYYHWSSSTFADDSLIARRMDLKSPVTGSASLDTYQYMKNGAPELLWQKRERYTGSTIFLNLNNKPLDDIRIRRAMALVLEEDDLITAYCGDITWGLPGSGIFHPAFGLPKEEIAKLMGWDKTMEERISEAQRLMVEAGYPNGFHLNMMSAETGARSNSGATMVFAEALRTQLKIDVEISAGLGTIEIEKRKKENNYDTYTTTLELSNPLQYSIYFVTDGYANYSNYSNPELDKLLGGIDYILDPEKRRETICEIYRILLTDIPVLPTGCFLPNFMPYYPWVKNLRWNYISYSNICRFQDVWIDESLRVR